MSEKHTDRPEVLIRMVDGKTYEGVLGTGRDEHTEQEVLLMQWKQTPGTDKEYPKPMNWVRSVVITRRHILAVEFPWGQVG